MVILSINISGQKKDRRFRTIVDNGDNREKTSRKPSIKDVSGDVDIHNDLAGYYWG